MQPGRRPGKQGLDPRLTLGTPGGTDQAGARDGNIGESVFLALGRPWRTIGRDPPPTSLGGPQTGRWRTEEGVAPIRVDEDGPLPVRLPLCPKDFVGKL